MFLPVFLCIVLSAGYTGAGETTDQPNTDPTAVWDFGYMPQKTEAAHVFYLHNTTQAPLTVNKIKSGCSCTGVSKVEKPIPPGDSAGVTVTFKSGRYRGAVKKTTHIYTSNPDHEIYDMTIIANVLKSDQNSANINITPRKFNWKYNDENFVFDDTVININNTGPDTVMMSLLHNPNNILKPIELPPSIAPEENISIGIMPLKKISDLSDMEGVSITFAFVAGDTTRITVPIKIKQ